MEHQIPETPYRTFEVGAQGSVDEVSEHLEVYRILILWPIQLGFFCQLPHFGLFLPIERNSTASERKRRGAHRPPEHRVKAIRDQNLQGICPTQERFGSFVEVNVTPPTS